MSANNDPPRAGEYRIQRRGVGHRAVYWIELAVDVDGTHARYTWRPLRTWYGAIRKFDCWLDAERFVGLLCAEKYAREHERVVVTVGRGEL